MRDEIDFQSFTHSRLHCFLPEHGSPALERDRSLMADGAHQAGCIPPEMMPHGVSRTQSLSKMPYTVERADTGICGVRTGMKDYNFKTS